MGEIWPYPTKAFSSLNLSYLERVHGDFCILFSCWGTQISLFLLVSGDQSPSGKDRPPPHHVCYSISVLVPAGDEGQGVLYLIVLSFTCRCLPSLLSLFSTNGEQLAFLVIYLGIKELWRQRQPPLQAFISRHHHFPSWEQARILLPICRSMISDDWSF